MGSAIIILLAMVLFGASHSLLAATHIKERLARWLGERFVHGWYRIVYNVISVVSFAPILALLAFLPDRVLYRASLPWAILLIAIQAVGVIGVLIGTLSTDWLRFVGLRQALVYLRGDDLPLPPEPLQITGLYRLVRHPLYLFSVVGLWATPFLTANVLAFNIGATLYFAIGLIFEEKRLVATYGNAYRAYQAQVPALLPLPRPTGSVRSHPLPLRSDTDHGKT